MPIPWSRCGKYELHKPHYAGYGSHCPGWTPGDQLVRDLVAGVDGYLREHYPPSFLRPVQLPEGLRLEMHPSVRRHLMTNPDLNKPGWPQARGDATEWFPVPVKIDSGLPEDAWRLVIVTEEVLLDSTRS